MTLHDNQAKYFGDDPKAPTAYILGMKAYYYIQYRPNDKQTPYNWLKQCVTELKDDATPTFLQQFVVLSQDLYKADSTFAATFISDYVFANDIIERNAANADLKNADRYGEIDTPLDNLFALSGAADCSRLEKVYGTAVEKNKTKLGNTSERIYFLKLPKSERREYLSSRGLLDEPRQEFRHQMRKEALENSEVAIGMRKDDVVTSLGKPLRVEVAGNPNYENERLGKTLTDFRKFTGNRLANYIDANLSETLAQISELNN